MPCVTDQARGTDPAVPPSRTVTKPLLVAVSHAIEEFAAAAGDVPLAVVAMFQQPSYFADQRDRYARIAGRSGVTVVGYAGEPPAHPEPGLTHVVLNAAEPLALEWSVTVLGPWAGATLVAHDLERVDGSARSLERGRLFTGRWSFHRSAARTELARLRTELGPRLPDATGAVLDEVLGRTGSAPRTDTHHDAAMTWLLDRLSSQMRQADDVRNRLDDVQPGAERDPHSGLATRAFLDRWTARSASGTLPVGLILLRVHELATVRHRHGLRAQVAVLQSVARILRGQIGAADRAVRVGREEFLLVLPSRDPDQLAHAAERVRAEISGLSGSHPYVPTPATAVITRTRHRPLPLGPLWAALDRATDAGVPVTVLGDV